MKSTLKDMSSGQWYTLRAQLLGAAIKAEPSYGGDIILLGT
jgi:hypothetical protein